MTPKVLSDNRDDCICHRNTLLPKRCYSADDWIKRRCFFALNDSCWRCGEVLCIGLIRNKI